jgi:hypothetical protein
MVNDDDLILFFWPVQQFLMKNFKVLAWSEEEKSPDSLPQRL